MSEGLNRPRGDGGDDEHGERAEQQERAERDERAEQQERAEHGEQEMHRESEADERAEGEESAGAEESAEGASLDSAEETLRELLRNSVRDLEPSPDTLNHLQRAVPARRVHRRQALVGAAAAVLVVAVGVPALFLGGVVPGVGDERHPLTASSSQGQSHGPEGGSGADGGKDKDQDKGGKGEGKDKGGKGDGGADPSPSGGPGNGSADPDDALTASAPSCGRDQLGQASAQAGSPDGQGKVYGSFRVANTSSDACTVEGEGMVGASVQGTERARVTVADHTTGDPAPGLGNPGIASNEVVLKPGAAYVVKFAYVPNGGCDNDPPATNSAQNDNGATMPSAGSDSGGDGGGGDNGAGGAVGTPGENGSGGDPPDDSSVVLTHTPEGGSPAIADTRVEGGCGGTVYRTGIIPAG
ncbi:hypothetical protein OIE63_18365 [Streptomyces sp. NBC_01795]|uniref:hypothetical protein n=1 Tax=Streptomyces sp. NBC_01795 TaxID=2975943 RepID=UPI002DD8C5B2|nr:hypothetical protein [Streptomyces sp. NBC_01795]WSA93324.1 hypothetical protein OIE63_18365 [Streptomyces sp. NBC_01795]